MIQIRTAPRIEFHALILVKTLDQTQLICPVSGSGSSVLAPPCSSSGRVRWELLVPIGGDLLPRLP